MRSLLKTVVKGMITNYDICYKTKSVLCT